MIFYFQQRGNKGTVAPIQGSHNSSLRLTIKVTLIFLLNYLTPKLWLFKRHNKKGARQRPQLRSFLYNICILVSFMYACTTIWETKFIGKHYSISMLKHGKFTHLSI